MTTVSLVEDDPLFTELVTRALRRSKTIGIASIHVTAEEALSEIPWRKPDVILMDIKLPGMDGIECLRRLRHVCPAPTLRAVVLTEHEDSDLVFESFKAGARGYLLKDHISLPELSSTIKAVAADGGVMSPGIARKVLRHFEQLPGAADTLSEREGQVLYWLAHGLMYKEIADRLQIGLNTVRKHTGAIYTKLQVRSRTEAARHYFQSGVYPNLPPRSPTPSGF